MEVIDLKFKIKATISLVLLMVLITSIGVFADGNGGGGSNNPFSLDTSMPAHQEKNVPVDSEIKLVFTKNVVNILVQENNMTCFKLQDENGQDVPVDIIMADDQIERDKKRDIILEPKSLLNEGAEYTIVIDSSLQSKSGQALEEDVILTFNTVSVNESFLSQQWIWVIGATMIVVIAFVAFRRKK